MAFAGDLEHLPIVDVIQLMNSTRKSGILSVKGRKGESQLVFKDGYIVSASHLNNSVRIGQVLVEMNLVSPQQIEQGLQKQQSDGESRRPLAITLIDMEILKEQDAYKALQRLIEITIVEILTWKSGKFTLDHLKDVIDCDFRYYPEKMNHEVNVNTQSILMDALRIFDEKKRDGLIQEEQDDPEAEEQSLDELISVDDLGLSEIDHLSAQLPQAFSGVVPFDPSALQREKIIELAPDLPASGREKLVAMLARYTKENRPDKGSAATPGVIVYSQDKLLQHALHTVLIDSDASPLPVMAEGELEKALGESFEKKVSWLIIDVPFKIPVLGKNSQIRIIQLAPGNDIRLALNAYRQGAAAVLPKPVNGQGEFMEEFILLLEFLPEYIRNYR
jgi:hypothetical protein